MYIRIWLWCTQEACSTYIFTWCIRKSNYYLLLYWEFCFSYLNGNKIVFLFCIYLYIKHQYLDVRDMKIIMQNKMYVYSHRISIRALHFRRAIKSGFIGKEQTHTHMQMSKIVYDCLRAYRIGNYKILTIRCWLAAVVIYGLLVTTYEDASLTNNCCANRWIFYKSSAHIRTDVIKLMGAREADDSHKH